MRVGVLELDSTSLRLFVAERRDGGAVPLREETERVAPGRLLERVEAHARIARELGAPRLDVVVPESARAALDADGLLHELAEAPGASVRVLSAEQEARLLFAGALAAAGDVPESVGICHVGDRATQIVVGTRTGGPVWAKTLPVGLEPLTEAFFAADPPSASAAAAARAEVEHALAAVVPPLPKLGLALGPAARALRAVVGDRLCEEELALAAWCLTRNSSEQVARRYEIDAATARTLPAAVAIFAEVERRLVAPFRFSRAGLGEGAAVALLAEARAA